MTAEASLRAQEMLTPAQCVWLERIGNAGTWPDRPFLRDTECSLPLMRMGLVEVIKPDTPFLSYAILTPAGRALLQREGV